MANVLIGYGNVFDKLTLSGGNWVSSMPLANLQNRRLGVVARSADLNLASTQFSGVMPAHNPVSCLAFANHNLALDAQYRLRCGSDAAFASWDYDSGWSAVWPAVYSTFDLEWEDSNWWDGRYTEDQRAGYTWTLTILLPKKFYSPYWRLEVDDRNNAAGFVQIGRGFAATGYQPGRNMSYGATLGWQDDSTVQAAISGAEFFDSKTPYRVATFQTEYLHESEGMAQAFELQRRAKLTNEVLFIWDPDDTVHALRRQFLGRIRTLSPLQFPQGFLDGEHAVSTGYEVKELVP